MHFVQFLKHNFAVHRILNPQLVVLKLGCVCESLKIRHDELYKLDIKRPVIISNSISAHAQYVTLQKYLLHPS
jgi:hypothetical protein